MDWYAIVAVSIAFISTLLGGLLAIKYSGAIRGLSAFAAGVLIAVALFDLLPEALSLASGQVPLLVGTAGLVALGFGFVYLIDKGLPKHHSPVQEKIGQRRGSLLIVTELAAHGLFEGLAIGLGFQVDFQTGLIIAIAIVCHDSSEGLSAMTIMFRSGNTLRSSLSMLALEAIAPVLGVLVTFLVSVPDYYLILSLPFFAGGFIYVGTLNLFSHRQSSSYAEAAYGLAGLFLILFISLMTS